MPRHQGSKNKITTEIKQRILDALNDSLDNLEADLSQLSNKDRLEIICKLLPYLIPRLRETDIAFSDIETPNEIRVNIIKSIDE